MSGPSRDLRLSAVDEQEDEDLLFQFQLSRNAEGSSPTPAPLISTSPVRSTPILRRLRTQLGRRASARQLTSVYSNAGGSSGSSREPGANFNPEAPEFVSTPRMPPKRKASSMGRSGKSTMSTPRNSNNQSSDHPIIHSEEVFHHGTLGIGIGDSSFDGMLSDEDHSEIFGLATAGNTRQVFIRDRNSMGEAISLMRTRMSKIERATPELIQSHSAILFSYDGEGSTAEESDDSARLRYLPLCAATIPSSTAGSRDYIDKSTPLTILPSHRERIDRAISVPLSTKAVWPPNELPMELFDLIAAHLSRDAVKSMRLVNKEFEKKVSCTLFHTSVVPFNTELYDMIEEDARAVSRASQPQRAKGKGKAGPWDIPGQDQSVDPVHGGLHWMNAKYDAEGKVYKGYGLRVFQGFGPHIRKFGMSFDVLEGQLSRPPVKRELDHVDSYHGSYDWPPESYTRFANLAGLERTADETSRMKSAFSHLTNVHDLALSVDSGLGWLNGPDKSIHARVFQRQSPIFGHSRNAPDQTQDANELWAALQSCNQSFGPHINQKEISLARRSIAKHPSELSGLKGTHYGDRRFWASIAANRAAPTISANVSEDLQYGVMYTTFATPDSTAQSLYDKSALVPSELRKEQKEWLLETEWAQRAFLECYVLAVMDNPDKFAMVKTLTIAKVSSGFLPLLARESFWEALPNLTNVTILVKPDWRSVEKDNAGFAETCPQNPSEAVRTFHRCVLRDRLCLRPGITKLNIGWASGGEHADGIFARNNHIMPAPITQLEHTTAANAANSGLVFKFVEHLTLTNCWMTPPVLEELVKSHAEFDLKTLTLDSVSLTSHPRFPAGGQAQGGAAVPAHIAQAIAANVMQLQQNQQAPQWMLQNFGQLQGNNQQQQQQQQQVVQQLMALQQGLGAGNAPANNIHGLGVGNALANNANAMGGGGGHQPANFGNAFGFGNGAPNGNAAGFMLPGGPQPPPVLAQPIPQALNNPAQQATYEHWSLGHREGSWPEVINKISPGPVFNDHLPQPAPWEEQHPPRAPTKLRTIQFKSCGYAKLYHSTAFDQFAIEAGHEHHLSVWFRSRQAALSPAMLTTTDRYLGRIIQYMPPREEEALLLGWGLSMGWNDDDKAEEVEYDGLLAGGTGRFSGTISEGMGLPGQQQV